MDSQYNLNTRVNINDQIEEQIDIVEGELMDKIQSMFGKGMAIASIAAALQLSPDVVQAAVTRSQITSYNAAFKLMPVDIVARTIYAEAQGESMKGKLAVASVIHTRAKGDPKKYVDTILKREQFSCWNAGAPPKGSGKDWDESVSIAMKMFSGKFQPIVKATHYFNPKKALPSWAMDRPTVAMIGGHRFLNIESEGV